MKWALKFIVPLIAFAAILLALRPSPVRPPANAVAAPAVVNAQPPSPKAEAVGWVFGRLIGFRGADRPLTRGTGQGFPPGGGVPIPVWQVHR